MALTPEIQAFLKGIEAANFPPVWETPLQVSRANTQGRLALAGAPESILKVENRYIAGPTSDLHIRIYTPTNNTSAPALVYFHGGGWVQNFIDMYDAPLHRIANQSGAVVIAVNYQKAPEHPYPAPFNDCFATLEWVIKNAQSLGVDPRKIGVGGDSAGGNIAAGVALKARDLHIDLAFQILVYPCIERDFTASSYQDFATGYALTTQATEWFWDQYLQTHEFDNDPYACPGKATSLNNVAPAVVLNAQYDPIVSDGIKYVELLKRDGVDVQARIFEGMVHGFFGIMAVTPMSKVALDYCAENIKRLTQ